MVKLRISMYSVLFWLNYGIDDERERNTVGCDRLQIEWMWILYIIFVIYESADYLFTSPLPGYISILPFIHRLHLCLSLFIFPRLHLHTSHYAYTVYSHCLTITVLSLLVQWLSILFFVCVISYFIQYILYSILVFWTFALLYFVS